MDKWVLVIDDEPMNILIAHDILGKEFNLKVATKVEQGIDLAMTAPLPDLIFLDLVFTASSGYEVWLELKQIDSLKDTPIVIFSSTKPDWIDSSKNLFFLGKPASPEEMLSVTRSLTSAYSFDR